VLRACLLAGPLGSGKTAVAVAMGDALEEAGVPYALVDLDWLCWTGPGRTEDDLLALLAGNLRDVARRYQQAGATTLVLTRAVTSEEQVVAIRAAVGGALVAFRLSVPDDVAAARLTARDDAADLAESDRIRAATAALHLPAVRNHGRSAAETAADLLTRLRWLPPARHRGAPTSTSSSSSAPAGEG
jgi:hypothetical protein